jgi:FK506-binding nuclear protein
MVAIDPTEEYSGDAAPRATLKIIRNSDALYDGLDDSDDNEDEESLDSDDIEAIKARLGITDEDLEGDSDEESDEEENGGPSDPEKARRVREQALLKDLEEGEHDDDLDMADLPNGVNGVSDKGKSKFLSLDDDIVDEDDEFVVCTLDPNQVCFRDLDLTLRRLTEVALPASCRHHDQ